MTAIRKRQKLPDGVGMVDQMFIPLECHVWLQRIAEYKKRFRPSAPNSMNKYGVTLEGRSFRSALARIVSMFAPHVRLKYPELGELLKHPYAFSVEYEMGKQKSLVTHYDSSDVTFNICLSGTFTGGELVFTDEKGKETTVEHQLGRMYVHRGTHLHRAKPITSGSRTNLILWCKAKAKK